MLLKRKKNSARLQASSLVDIGDIIERVEQQQHQEGNATQIQYLDLSKNSILSIDDSSVWARFRNLRELDISSNEIASIDALLCLPVLKHLDVSNNLLQVIPSKLILQCTTLKALPNSWLGWPPMSLFSKNGRTSRKLTALCKDAEASPTHRFYLDDNVFFHLWTSVSSSQRSLYRKYMEDRSSVKFQLNSAIETPQMINAAHSAYCGVFDGHLGAAVADFMVEHLHEAIERRGLLDVASLPGVSPDDARSRFVDAFLECDERVCDVLEAGGQHDGSTALVCCVVGKRVAIAHAGDSRAVLGTRGGVAVPLTKDHKPDDPEESARILAAGGTVAGTGSMGVPRVNGILAMSRAMGDVSLKRPVRYLECAPDVKFFELTADDEWMVMATDGLWDVVSNDAAISHIQKCKTAEEASAKLLSVAKRNGTVDNTLVLVLKFEFGAGYASELVEL